MFLGGGGNFIFRAANQIPPGFTSIFNGKDFTDWRGRQRDLNPRDEGLMSPIVLSAKQSEWNANRDLHWAVDPARSEIVSDGKGVHLATVKDYGDSSSMSTR